MKLIIEFLTKPARVKWMLFRAMVFSIYYKSIIKNREFAVYAKKMGTFNCESPKVLITDERILEVKWVAYAVKRWTPWQTKCFDQALMAKRLLNGYGLPCTLYMGVKTDRDGKMIAHAWLRCGTEYVCGGNGAEYAVTGIYGERA